MFPLPLPQPACNSWFMTAATWSATRHNPKHGTPGFCSCDVDICLFTWGKQLLYGSGTPLWNPTYPFPVQRLDYSKLDVLPPQGKSLAGSQTQPEPLVCPWRDQGQLAQWAAPATAWSAGQGEPSKLSLRHKLGGAHQRHDEMAVGLGGALQAQEHVSS